MKEKLLETNAPQKPDDHISDSVIFLKKINISSKAKLLQSSKCSSGNITNNVKVIIMFAL